MEGKIKNLVVSVMVLCGEQLQAEKRFRKSTLRPSELRAL
jgi:hypothetical protein